jgi:hypothetical protein
MKPEKRLIIAHGMSSKIVEATASLLTFFSDFNTSFEM